MPPSKGPRARARTRTVRGRVIHEALVFRGSGPPSTVRFPTAAEAERQAEIFAAELDAGTLDAPADWQGMIDAFLDARSLRAGTVATYRYRLDAVAATFPRRDPLTLSARDAQAYIRGRLATGVSPTTVRAEVDTIAILQRWCVRRGWCRVATWADVERPEPRRREAHMQPDRIGAFLRAAERLAEAPPGESRPVDWRYWPAAAWLLMHGLRAGEVQHLRVRDVDLTHGVVHVRDRAGARTKTRRSDRAVPVLSLRALDASAKAMVYRASRLGLISPSMATRYYIKMNREWHGVEPDEPVPERPRWLRERIANPDVIRALEDEVGLSEAAIQLLWDEARMEAPMIE